MSSRSAGCAPRRPTSARTPSASTISRWSFSSAARWPTTSPTSCSIRSCQQAAEDRRPRLARPARTGAGRRPGQRRARAAGRLLPRLDGHAAAPGHGLRPALRIRHLPADHRGRLAARTAGQLAAAARSVGGRPPAGDGGGPARTARSRCAAARFARSSASRRSLLGIPFDRPVVGYGGKTINTLRLWAAAAPDVLRLPGIQQRRLRRRAGRDAHGRIRSPACSIPTIPPAWGRDCASCRSISSSPARWPTSCAASARHNADWSALPDKVAIQLNDTHPPWPCPS